MGGVEDALEDIAHLVIVRLRRRDEGGRHLLVAEAFPP